MYFFFVFFIYNIVLYIFFFFFSSRRRHTRYIGDWSSDVCSSDLDARVAQGKGVGVALAAVADDGHVLALDQGEVGVVVVEHLSHWGSPSGLSSVGTSWGAGVVVRVTGSRGSALTRLAPQPTVADGGAGIGTGRRVRSLIDREPRPMTTIPD